MGLKVQPTGRMWLIVLHDAAVSVVALFLSFYVRFQHTGFGGRDKYFLLLFPAFFALSVVIDLFLQIYKTDWRFFSIFDMGNVVKTTAILAVSLLVLDYILLSPGVFGNFYFGKATILLFCILQIFLLAASRGAYRTFRQSRTKRHAVRRGAQPAIAVGKPIEVEALLRAVESEAITTVRIVGILSPSAEDRGQFIRGVEVLGCIDDFAETAARLARSGMPIERVVLTSSALAASANPENVITVARRLNIQASRLPSLDEHPASAQLAPISIDELLLRPSVKIDYDPIVSAISGKAVVVTGAGGSIGSEVSKRVARFGAARLLLLEHSEPALDAILDGMSATNSACQIAGRIADVRDRGRIDDLFAEFKPDIVFHSAALKHVPILERDWAEGVKTNVLGSVNVAEAALAAGAKAVVMISTDKAVEPVSILGMTKRIAEMYCQSLDADLVGLERGRGERTRLTAVRFGNVLASSGSVVPKFRAQIERGGPITITHQDMVRYFMTVGEACDLVIASAAHILKLSEGGGSVYVLEMGQPLRIADLADRLIRLSGLVPGVDVQTVTTGVRPGEKLRESVFSSKEVTLPTGIPGILAARSVFPPLARLRDQLASLKRYASSGNRDAAVGVMREILGAEAAESDQAPAPSRAGDVEAIKAEAGAQRPGTYH